jgi:hypothetical protein
MASPCQCLEVLRYQNQWLIPLLTIIFVIYTFRVILLTMILCLQQPCPTIRLQQMSADQTIKVNPPLTPTSLDGIIGTPVTMPQLPATELAAMAEKEDIPNLDKTQWAVIP